MKSLTEQSELIKLLHDQIEHTSLTPDDDREILKCVLESLNKLKAQEDLIDAQADELIVEHKKGSFGSRVADLKQDTTIRMLDEIKETVHAIANKMGIAVITEYPDKNTVKTTTIVENGKIEELKVSVDPAIVLLLGANPSEIKGYDLIVLSTELEHDIAILKETRRSKMAMTSLSQKLEAMHYKTSDLELLQDAYVLIQTYLPF